MNNKTIILGFGLSEVMKNKVLEEDLGMPTQTFNFADNLRSSLKCFAGDVFMVSSHPVSTYPKNPRKYFGFERFSDSGSHGFTIPFINIFLLKHITRFLCGFFLLANFIRSSKYDNIIVHGIHSPFLAISCLVNIIFNINIFCVVTDPPVIPDDIGVIERVVRKIDRVIIFFFLNRFSGLIVLSELFVKDNDFKLPYLVVDGFCKNKVVDKSNVDDSKDASTSLFKFAYAGGLNEEYGVKTLVEAVIQLEGVELALYGKGLLHDYLLKVSKENKRIVYKGFIPPYEINEKLLLADCLVNPRPSSPDFVRYSFPSKTIEYMALGLPLLMTRLPSLSDDYLPHIFVIQEETVSGMVTALTYVSRQSSHDLEQVGINGQSFVLQTRSFNAQGSRLEKFLNSI
jgi:glycosyltransferase involved in cell wall biosynthesis